MVTIIYSTIGSIKDARNISKVLLKEKMVACVNIIPKVESIYIWQGKIEKSEEVIIIAKTTDKNVKKVIEKIKSLHTYELPDLIVLKVNGGLKDYLDYIASETI
jgi:periplasmic divalent cation tolerance protein